MPEPLKIAMLDPLLKKVNPDSDIFKTLDQSNLKFLSKLVERAVFVQLNEYLVENELHEVFQSAYKSFHSTETSLLRVQNDILQSLDKKQSVILVLLDLSAAFDTIGHEILLSRLAERFGISGNVLAWFKSHLSSRSQFVNINGTYSSTHKVLSSAQFSIYFILPLWLKSLGGMILIIIYMLMILSYMCLLRRIVTSTW